MCCSFRSKYVEGVCVCVVLFVVNVLKVFVCALFFQLLVVVVVDDVRYNCVRDELFVLNYHFEPTFFRIFQQYTCMS